METSGARVQLPMGIVMVSNVAGRDVARVTGESVTLRRAGRIRRGWLVFQLKALMPVYTVARGGKRIPCRYRCRLAESATVRFR